MMSPDAGWARRLSPWSLVESGDPHVFFLFPKWARFVEANKGSFLFKRVIQGRIFSVTEWIVVIKEKT